MTQYELAKRYMQMYATKLGELVAYGWSDDLKLSYINKFIEELKCMEGYEQINPNSLSKSQLIELGGCAWSDENPDLILIPLWLFPHLPERFKGASFDGKELTLKVSEMDNDHRFGCIAYGVLLKD